LGDSFLAAGGEENAGILLSGNHGDFDCFQQAGLIGTEFIRTIEFREGAIPHHLLPPGARRGQARA
jgi:hypothetical protein